METQPGRRRPWTRWRKIVVFGSLGFVAAGGVFGGAWSRETLLFIGAVLLYLAPAFVASTRRKPNAGTVTAITVLLGWTGIGWILALLMACT